MKRPTWGTVIGILMICFGGCSVLNNIKSISLPAKLEEAKAKHEEKEKTPKIQQAYVATTRLRAQREYSSSSKQE